jgi:hypothetical protein
MVKHNIAVQDLPVPYLRKNLTGYKKNNKTVIAAQYERGYSFCPHNQTAVVAWNVATNNKNRILKWGIIDINGNSVAINDPDHFTWMTPWQVGKQISYSFFTTHNGVPGIITSKGHILFKGEEIFDIIIDNDNDIEIAILHAQEYFIFLDLLTRELSDFFSDIIPPFNKNGCCLVRNIKGDLQLIHKTRVVETFDSQEKEEVFSLFTR